MRIAVHTNVRTTKECAEDIHNGFVVAYRGGQVLGFSLVAMALLVLQVLIMAYRSIYITETSSKEDVRMMFEMIAGYGLGASTVALFGRVGGGIYTKAADVGSDLAGKVVKGLEEDSPENPGVIADNVGDNVGDIAGMGADLFGSLAESTCAALVVGSTSEELIRTPDAIYFPLLITGAGILASFLTAFLATNGPKITMNNVETTVKVQLVVSTILMSGAVIPLTYFLPAKFYIGLIEVTPWRAYFCVFSGLWSGFIIGFITEVYTSSSYAPVKGLAEACRMGAAPNIILGLALGYMSTVVPILCIAVTIYISFSYAGMYGISLAALGMLGCLPIALSIDGYGPISDNAGGIAEMSGLHSDVRTYTDKLDAAGNTTAAIGKGFAIGSACLVALALFGAYVTRTSLKAASLVAAGSAGSVATFEVNILNPLEFSGLLIGAMLPYAFSAMTMQAVGDAANDMIAEIARQFRENEKMLSEGKSKHEPDYERCIAISTKASLRMMIAPGLLVLLSPLLMGFLFGAKAVSGLLAGAIVSGVQIAFSFSNTGGAWDNAKKFVEAGKHVSTNTQIIGDEDETGKFTFRKGTDAHKAAVCGDTVGDPLKDTSGPAINILIKLSAITSLVFGDFFVTNGGILLKA